MLPPMWAHSGKPDSKLIRWSRAIPNVCGSAEAVRRTRYPHRSMRLGFLVVEFPPGHACDVVVGGEVPLRRIPYATRVRAKQVLAPSGVVAVRGVPRIGHLEFVRAVSPWDVGPHRRQEGPRRNRRLRHPHSRRSRGPRPRRALRPRTLRSRQWRLRPCLLPRSVFPAIHHFSHVRPGVDGGGCASGPKQRWSLPLVLLPEWSERNPRPAGRCPRHRPARRDGKNGRAWPVQGRRRPNRSERPRRNHARNRRIGRPFWRGVPLWNGRRRHARVGRRISAPKVPAGIHHVFDQNRRESAFHERVRRDVQPARAARGESRNVPEESARLLPHRRNRRRDLPLRPRLGTFVPPVGRPEEGRNRRHPLGRHQDHPGENRCRTDLRRENPRNRHHWASESQHAVRSWRKTLPNFRPIFKVAEKGRTEARASALGGNS